MIRTLYQNTDTAIVADMFRRAADYVMLESGRGPGDAEVQDFFTGAPPGIDPTKSLHLGLFAPGGQLVAIAGAIFGFPNPDDAYLGLLLIDPAHRGKRLGQQMVDHICAATKAQGATRILIAVLEENTKAHRFWVKLGFTEEMRSQPKEIGLKTHVQIRMTRSL
jgi:ribosomal protein S18 acetylase RimI-like enzyme